MNTRSNSLFVETSNEHVDKVTDDDEQLTVGCEKTSTNDEVDEDNPTSSIVYVHVSDVKSDKKKYL
ncbi:17399_t:CDS:2 [Entrophospora sp. SA101]|nr:17399_t:CDS:2 [Entrophospora sp. SA101]